MLKKLKKKRQRFSGYPGSILSTAGGSTTVGATLPHEVMMSTVLSSHTLQVHQQAKSNSIVQRNQSAIKGLIDPRDNSKEEPQRSESFPHANEADMTSPPKTKGKASNKNKPAPFCKKMLAKRLVQALEKQNFFDASGLSRKRASSTVAMARHHLNLAMAGKCKNAREKLPPPSWNPNTNVEPVRSK